MKQNTLYVGVIYGTTLKFVDFFDIPDHDNCESVYIPMFKNAEVFIV